MIKSFDMRESYVGGGQDLTIFMREVDDVVRAIMEDTSFKEYQRLDSKKSSIMMDSNSYSEVGQVLELPFR